MLALLDRRSGLDGAAAPRQRERARLPAPARSPTRRASSRRAEALFSDVDRQSRFYASALYFRGLIARAPGPLRDRRAATCARSSSRPTRTASPSSSTAATTRSRTWPTWRWAASRTSRASTTTPTTSTSASPRTRSACPTRCSRRRGRCSRRASTRRRGAFIEEFDRVVPQVAAGARRAAAARDDRSQVVPRSTTVRSDAGQAREDLRARSRPRSRR